MGRWQINRQNAGWVALSSSIEYTLEELNGHKEASFVLPNTPANRTLVGVNQGIQVTFDGSEVFNGTLYAPTYGRKDLTCVVYDAMFELMKKRTISGEFYTAPANILFGSVCTAAGLPYGTAGASGSLLSVRFDEAYCFDAANWIAQTCSQDRWAEGGTVFMGSRGVILEGTLDYSGQVGDHGVDRSKVVSKVRIRGVDIYGLRIYGEAGAGSDVAVFTDKKGCDQATLNMLAAKKLTELQQESTGVIVKVPSDVGVGWRVGDWKAIQIPELALDGTYRIFKNTTYKRTSELEVDRAKSSTESDIDATEVYEELGIYKLDPSMMTPLSVGLGGLRELYHLNADAGTRGINSAPLGTYTSANDGVISNYSWDEIGQLIGLHLSDGSMVTTHPQYLSCRGFSVVAWVSPLGFGTTAYSDSVICGGPGKFDVGFVGTLGAVGFKLVAGGTYQGTMQSRMGTFTRNMIAAVYDSLEGSAYLYHNGSLQVAFATGNNEIDLPSPTYWGYKYHGYLGEASLWSRALSGQEVHELYFFPLNRIVAATGGATGGGGTTAYVEGTLGYVPAFITSIGTVYTPTPDVVGSLSSVGSLTITGNGWICGVTPDWIPYGSTNPYGTVFVTAGSALYGTAYPLGTTVGYVLAKTPWKLGTLPMGTCDQNGLGTVLFPAQGTMTINRALAQYIQGYSVWASGSVTVLGYRARASGGTERVSQSVAAGTANHWEWYLNGANMGRAGTTYYDVPPQTNGSGPHTVYNIRAAGA